MLLFFKANQINQILLALEASVLYTFQSAGSIYKAFQATKSSQATNIDCVDLTSTTTALAGSIAN
jgi:hypothetical protein